MEQGWYNDPYDRYLRRYFDGNEWTNHVQTSAGEVVAETSPGMAQPPEGGSPLLAPPQGAPSGKEISNTSVKKSRKTLWVGVGVGVLIIAGIAASADDSSSNTSESSSEDTKMAEEPESSSDSSATSGLDQSDFASTSESSTGSNSDPSAFLDYISDVTQVNDDGVEYMERFSNLMFRSDAFSEEWQLDVAMVLVMLSGQYDRVLDIEAPACFEDVHSHMLEANRLLVVMSQTFAEGVDTLDPAKIEQATEILYQSTDETTKATALLNEFDPSECL